MIAIFLPQLLKGTAYATQSNGIPCIAIHGNQNLSTYLTMLLRILTSACYLFPEGKEDTSLRNSPLNILHDIDFMVLKS